MLDLTSGSPPLAGSLLGVSFLSDGRGVVASGEGGLNPTLSFVDLDSGAVTPFLSGGFLSDNPFEPGTPGRLWGVAVSGSTIVALTENPKGGATQTPFILHLIDPVTGTLIDQFSGLSTPTELEVGGGSTCVVTSVGIQGRNLRRIDLTDGQTTSTFLGDIVPGSLDGAYVPEPSTATLLALGLALLGGRRRRH